MNRTQLCSTINRIELGANEIRRLRELLSDLFFHVSRKKDKELIRWLLVNL
jgi:hypothetical protein